MFLKFVFLAALFVQSIKSDDEDKKPFFRDKNPFCVPRADLLTFGNEYQGKRAETINGVKCETWSKSVYFSFDDDEEHSFYFEEHNYCRGYKFMGNENYGPWCFLSLSYEDENERRDKILWEPCFPSCEDKSKSCVRYYEIPFKMFDYSGTRSQSISWKTCRNWKEMYSKFYGSELRQWNHNFCRAAPILDNPSVLPHPRVPWCHTDSTTSTWEPCFENCHDVAKCIERLETTLPYKGKRSKTVNELECDPWANKNNNLTKLYPGISDDKNYCRNFGLLSTGPFCLVNLERSPGKVLIEPCFDHCEDLSEKKPCIGPDKMTDYWGSRRRTVNGYICQRWDVQKPYNHSFVAKDFGVDELWEISNFCRNPDSSLDGPWCFVTNGPVIREPCFHHCTGVEDQDGITTTDTYTMLSVESIPIGSEGSTQAYWIIFLVIMGILLLSLISDLCCRNCCLNSLRVDKSLNDAKKVIELCRPGVPGSRYENATKEQIENWMKLVDQYNALKKQKSYAYEGIE